MQNTATVSTKPKNIINNNNLIRDSHLQAAKLYPASFASTATQTKDTNNDTKQDYILRRHGYSISIVKSLKQQLKTNTFLKYMYSARGYRTEATTITINDPNQITLIASIGETIVGTLSMRIDSQHGLLADELYQSEINMFREKERTVCELSKLAVDSKVDAHEIIASLFQCIYKYAQMHNVKDFFCEVNPRHAGPQKRMFGFKKIGALRTCPRVNAPAVLLHLELDYITSQLNRLADLLTPSKNSLYSYFLPHHVEKRITKALQNKLTHYKPWHNAEMSLA